MRWMFFLLLLIGVGYFVYLRMISSTVALMDECLIQAKSEIETSGRSPSGLCVVNEQTLDRLSVCLSSVQQQKVLGGLLFGPTGIEDKVTIMVKTHNQMCSENEVPLPTAEMYL